MTDRATGPARNYAMKYRTLGKSGLQVSELVFGAGAVGGIVINPDDDTKRAAVIQALRAGVNWIDTAASYGNGRSEESLGWVLKETLPTPHLSTKFRVDHAKGDAAGQVERSMAESLRRLQRQSVDLFQLHNAVTMDRGSRTGSLTPDDVLRPGGVLEGLRRVQAQKLTRYVGLTAMGDIAAINRLVDSGEFDTAQVYHNILNPSAARRVPAGFSAYDYGDLIGRCHSRGVGVLNIRVLAAGAIAMRDHTQPWQVMSPGSDFEADLERARQVREVVGTDHGTMAQVAVRYALSEPRTSGVLVGFSTLAHITEAVGAVERGPLPADVLRKVGALQDSDFGRFRAA